MRRVVVTGLGLVSPLAHGVEHSWARLLNSQSGAGRITHFDTDDLACKVAASVPAIDGHGGGGADYLGAFDPDSVMSARDRSRIADFILFGITAADEALKDAGICVKNADTLTQSRIGVSMGSGVGGLEATHYAGHILDTKGPKRVNPFTVPGMVLNLISGNISIRHGLKGPNHCVVTACAAGTHSIGDSMHMIARGDADVMVAGGAEASICRLGIACFLACRAMTTHFNDTPEQASRPYDKDRDGFLMGEGAGALILEEYECARARGAKIYAEVKGYGLSGDAYHITSPSPDGDGGFRAMQMALKNANMKISDIDYINAHGTSTPVGDEAEVRAVERLLGGDIRKHAQHLSMSSTKSATGHLLGAAGAVEAVFSVLALRDQVAPPTLNLHNQSFDSDINLVPLVKQKRSINAVLSNSFGFGGTNGSLIFTHVD